MAYGNYPPRRERNDADFPNSGTMHLREKKNPKAPDMGGDFTLDGEILDHILKEMNKGATTVKLEISAWRRMGRNNNQFWSVSIRTPWEGRRDDSGGYQQSRTTGYQNQRDDYERGNNRGYQDQDRTQGDSRDYRGGGQGRFDDRDSPPDERQMVNQGGQRNPYAEQRGDRTVAQSQQRNPYEGGRTDFRTSNRETPQQAEQRNRDFSKGDSLPDFGPPKGRTPF